jgi:hypothetical protein
LKERSWSALDFAMALHDIAPDLPIILAIPSARDLDAPRLAASGISEVVHHPLMSAELARAFVPLSSGLCCLAVVVIDQTRGDSSLRSNERQQSCSAQHGLVNNRNWHRQRLSEQQPFSRAFKTRFGDMRGLTAKDA